MTCPRDGSREGAFVLCGRSPAGGLGAAAGGLGTATDVLGVSGLLPQGCWLPVRLRFFCRFRACLFCRGAAVFIDSSSDAAAEPSFDCISGGKLPRASRRRPSGFIEMASVLDSWWLMSHSLLVLSSSVNAARCRSACIDTSWRLVVARSASSSPSSSSRILAALSFSFK